MSVAFDAKTTLIEDTGYANTTHALTGGPTVGASATILIFGTQVETTSGSVTGVIWDDGGTNQNMTQIGTTLSLTGGNSAASVSFWGLVNPTPGAKTTAVTCSGLPASQHAYWFSISFTGSVTTSVAAATEGFNTATGTVSPLSVTTAVSIPGTDMAVAFGIDQGAGCNTGTTENFGGTQIGENENSSNNGCAAYFTGAGGTVTASAVLAGADNWGAMIVGIAAPGSAGPTPYNDYIAQPQLSSIQAQRRKSFSGWTNPDHRWRRWRRQRGLIVPTNRVIMPRKAA